MPDGHSLLIKKVLTDVQGKYMYSYEEQKCIMWDVNTAMQLYTFQPGSINGMDVSQDGKLLCLLAGGNLHLYSTVTGKLLKETKGYNNFEGVLFSESGKEIFTTKGGLVILSLNLETLYAIKSTNDSKGDIYKLPNQKVLLVGSQKEIYNPGEKTVIPVNIQNNGAKYFNHVFLPFQQLLAFFGNGIPVDFYDIYTGKKLGSIPGKRMDDVIIPSQTSSEILIHGGETAEGFYGLDLYNTQTFKLVAKHSNVNTKKYHPINAGYFDGKKKFSFFSSYNELQKLNFSNAKKINFEGYAASLGMDVFNTIQYHSSTGRLHINTDDVNLKTIDLYRLVPIAHNNLRSMPSALSVSPSGDTVAFFDSSNLTLRNLKKKSILRPPTPVTDVAFLNREAFFFENDGKSFWYSTYKQGNFKLLKSNTTTGVKQEILNLKGLGQSMVLGDHTMMAGFENGYQVNQAKVWNLNTGRELFSKPLLTGGNYDEQYISISKDKNKIIIVRNRRLIIYDINGNELSNAEIGYLDKFGSFVASNDLSLFVTGSRFGELIVYRQNGSMAYKIQAHNSTVRKVVFSPDDKLIYTISLDNTIRVWEASTGRLIGTLYLFKDTNDYVFMDIAGRFDGTPEGMKKVYYVLDRKSLPLGRLFERYYTPGLYARLVGGEVFEPLPDIIKSAPTVKIRYAALQRNLEVGNDKLVHSNTTGVAEITVDATAPDDKVDEIRLFHNGKVVTITSRNLLVTDNDGNDTKKYTVNLLPGSNSFRAISLNSQRTESDADQIEVIYKVNGAAAAVPAKNLGTVSGPIDQIDKQATLHLMVVGINAYTNKINPLTYALPDATAFKEEIEKDAKSVLANVKTYFISDAKANSEGIKNALNEIKKNAKPKDVFIFYYAGHGYIHPTSKEFYLVSADVTDAGESLLKNGIAAKELQNYAVDILAQKQLFILDACQSAGAYEKMLKHDGEQQKSLAVVSRSTGTHWIAASGSTETAKEFSQLGHGAFTYVLLQALKGQASNNKMITVNGLKDFLQIRVPEIVKKYGGNSQLPSSYGFGNDFPVELIK